MGRAIHFNPAYRQTYDLPNRVVRSELGQDVLSGVYAVHVYPIKEREGHPTIIVALLRNDKIRVIYEYPEE